MKNKKSFLTLLFAISALLLSACNIGSPRKASDNPKSENNDTSVVDDSVPSSTAILPSTHEHSFGEWTVSKAATCTEKGEERRVCECGEERPD